MRAGVTERNRSRFGMSAADPFSDRPLAAYFCAIPQHVANRVTQPKRLVVKTVAPLLPSAARGRLGKVEPVRLFDRGFRERARDTVDDLTGTPRAADAGWLDPSALRTAITGYREGKPVRHDFWWPLMLEIWLRRHWN
jgi:hypothetical protein